jgi:serine/threonine protein kinase
MNPDEQYHGNRSGILRPLSSRGLPQVNPKKSSTYAGFGFAQMNARWLSPDFRAQLGISPESPPVNLHIGDYFLSYKIGSGAMATVFLGGHDRVGGPLAIKQIPKWRLTKQVTPDELIRTTPMPIHQNLTELFDILEDSDSLYFVMELAEHGSINRILERDAAQSETACRRIFYEICIGLGHLHNELGLLHQNLHAENVLLDEKDDVRLSDFALSAVLPHSSDRSPTYTAPEVIQLEQPSTASDLWSAGVLLYVMATGRFPFEDRALPRLVNKFVNQPLSVPENLSGPLRDLLSKLLQKSPSERIQITDIIRHPWLDAERHSETGPPFASAINDHTPDASILSWLEGRKIDVSQLPCNLLQGERSPETIMYRIRHRQKAVLIYRQSIKREPVDLVHRDSSCPEGFKVRLSLKAEPDKPLPPKPGKGRLSAVATFGGLRSGTRFPSDLKLPKIDFTPQSPDGHT